MNKILIDHLKHFEGCRLAAYKCPAGVWTCGYGETEGVKPGLLWTQGEADRRLAISAQKSLDSAMKQSPVLLTANESKQAAIASFIYNCGAGAYSRSSLKIRVDACDWNGAAEQLGKWVNANGKPLKGLIVRREAEAKMILA